MPSISLAASAWSAGLQTVTDFVLGLGDLDWSALATLVGLPVSFAAAIIASRAARATAAQVEAPDRAVLVAAFAAPVIDLTLSAQSILAKAPDGDAPRLRITNAGPGVATMLEIEGQLVVDKALQVLIDTPRLRPFGPDQGPSLGYLGLPVGMAFGAVCNGALSVDHERYTLEACFTESCDVLHAKDTVEIALPSSVLRAFTVHQAIADDAGLRSRVSLRLRVRYVTGLGHERERSFLFTLGEDRRTVTAESLTFKYQVVRRIDRQVPESIRRFDGRQSAWNRQNRYLQARWRSRPTTTLADKARRRGDRRP